MGQLVRSHIRVGFVILAMALSVAVLPRVTARLLSGPGGDVREIRVNVRDMTYYVDGSASPNPTLRVGAGQRIRIVVNNEDAGMLHDLRIPAWGVGTRLLKGKGTDAFDFTAPNVRGSYPYTCTPHAAMMQGVIEVE